jgi:hypothetical protein
VAHSFVGRGNGKGSVLSRRRGTETARLASNVTVVLSPAALSHLAVPTTLFSLGVANIPCQE